MRKLLIRIGLASADVRLKTGKALWREFEEFLPSAKGNKNDDRDRLDLFGRMYLVEEPHLRKCLKEWLETEVTLQELGLQPEWMAHNCQVYREHLEFIEKI